MANHSSTLLIEAPVGRHFCQLHRDPVCRAESVALFIESGLRRSKGVVAIVAEANADDYLDRVRGRGLDPEPYRRSGAFALLHAEDVLARIAGAGPGQWGQFRGVVGGLIERVRPSGQGSVRVYGEMVDLLWKRGEFQTAIRLEQHWNDLARLHPFSMFCTYMLDSAEAGSYDGPLHEIGHAHSDIIATDDDERFREALDAASRNILGGPLTEVIGRTHQAGHPGEDRLPAGQRTMLWIMRNMPGSGARVLELARRRLNGKRP